MSTGSRLVDTFGILGGMTQTEETPPWIEPEEIEDRDEVGAQIDADDEWLNRDRSGDDDERG